MLTDRTVKISYSSVDKKLTLEKRAFVSLEQMILLVLVVPSLVSVTIRKDITRITVILQLRTYRFIVSFHLIGTCGAN